MRLSYAQEHDSESESHHDTLLGSDDESDVDLLVELCGQLLLRPKRLGGSDGRNDLLGERSRLGDLVEGGLLVLGCEDTHEGTGHGDTRQDGRQGEGEPPRSSVGEHETRHEGGDVRDGEGDLFTDTGLDEMAVGLEKDRETKCASDGVVRDRTPGDPLLARTDLDPGGDLSGSKIIVVGHVLAKGSLEVVLTDPLGRDCVQRTGGGRLSDIMLDSTDEDGPD